MVSKFDSLSARPPTPPKDLKDIDTEIDDALQFLDDPFGTKQLLKTAVPTKALLNTPEQSPSSSEAGTSSTSRKKRVNFEPQICTIPKSSALTTQSWTPRHSSPLRPLPQTRVSRPLRSILKPADPASSPPPTDEGSAAHKFQSIPEMLESVVKMLAQGSRPSKLDAYIAIQRTMQAYNNFPDIAALSNKMGLFAQFITRDIQAIGISGSGPDTQLVQQALKFLMALLRINELKPALDDDFCFFLVDRSITVCADSTMPKAIVNTHLALLMQQNFRPRVMTIVRVERILDVLDSIHDRVTGYSVQAYRIRIYRKLIQQRPEVMAKHTERWFKVILKAMLSSSKDIHESALDTAVTAAKLIGNERSVTKGVLSLLNRVKSDGDSFGKLFANQLEKALDQESAALVPLVWGAVTTFLQEPQSLQDSAVFSAAREWLQLFEKFLESGKEAVRINANIAFTCLAYALNLTEATDKHWTGMLLKISRTRMDVRKDASKSEVGAATSGYLTLLYYGLRPAASTTQLSRYWNEFVADFWDEMAKKTPSSHPVAACRTVSALLKGSRKPWNLHRGLEFKLSAMIQLSELPMLDPRWVRKSLATILQLVETLLEAAPWTSTTVDDEPVKTMWISLLDSLVEAGSKEVMATIETKDAVAHIVNMLRRMWTRHTTELAIPQQKEDSWSDKFCFLIESVVQKLGALQFADKCLTRNRKDEFEVAGTPSNRSRQGGSRVSPLLYLLDLLVSQSEGKLSEEVRLRVMQLILEPCVEAQNSRLAKLELLRDCSVAVGSASRGMVAANFWSRMWTLAKSYIDQQPADSNERVSRQLGKEYDVVVEILVAGASHLPNSTSGQELLSALADAVRNEAGDGAVVLAVVEKVSGSLLEPIGIEDIGAYLPYLSILLKNFPRNIARRNLEQGRKNLYPSSPVPARGQEFDPYNHLYQVLLSFGTAAYHDVKEGETESPRDFLSALGASIQRSPSSFTAVYLRKIQSIINIWVEDPEKKLRGKGQDMRQLRREIVNLWQTVSDAITKVPKKESSLLAALEPLLSAGFSSRRRKVVSISVTTWNASFGEDARLQYPPRLAKALKRLRNMVELSVPSLEPPTGDSDDPPSFDESDGSASDLPREKPTPRVAESPFRITKSAHKSRSPAVSSTSSRRVSSRRTPKVRLRHDDSQIMFEPIASSPTNIFRQESQILTERQMEMIERQRRTTSMFSGVGSRGDSQAAQMSPNLQELHSDALTADDLPDATSRTPLQTLAAMTPVEAYLGSSPTPRARNRSQQVLSDETNIATPNAVRTVQIAEGMDELSSSPPQFEKTETAVATTMDSTHADGAQVADFTHKESDNLYSSFYEGTTIEDMMQDVEAFAGPSTAANHENPLTSELDSTDLPSSTIEIQLNAQLLADLDGRENTSPVEETAAPGQVVEKSNNVYVGAVSQRLMSDIIDLTDDDLTVPQIEQLQTGTTVAGRNELESGDTSRVGDSFSGSFANNEDGKRQTRRSSQVSIASTPGKHTATKRGRGRPRKNNTPAATPQPTRTQETQVRETQQEHIPSDGDDCIVLAPASASSKKKRKRSKSQSQTPSQSQTVVPETTVKLTRKRSALRSASLLNESEPHAEEVLVEDTPAPKRSRKNASQDVSHANMQSSQAKRLSHVRVSPRRPGSRASSHAVEEDSMILDVPAQADKSEQKEDAASQAQDKPTTSGEPSGTQSSTRSFAERVILTPKSILEKLQKWTSDLSQMVLGRDEERQLDDAMFEFRTAVHDAGRRGRESGQ